MKHISCTESEGLDALSIGIDGASKMIVRLLSDDMVLIEIETGGHTPDHTHPDKERIVLISGIADIKLGKDRRRINTGDFVEFDPDEQHQVLNLSDERLVFLCLRNQ